MSEKSLSKLKERLQAKLSRDDALDGALGAGAVGGFIPPRTEEPTPQLNAEARKRLRDGMELWEELRQKQQDGSDDRAHKRNSVMLSMHQQALIYALQPIVPDPASGIGGLAGALLGPMLEVLAPKLQPQYISITINDPPAETQDKIRRLEYLLNAEEEADPQVVRELTAAVEPYVLVLPWELYKQATNWNTMGWAASHAAKQGFEKAYRSKTEALSTKDDKK